MSVSITRRHIIVCRFAAYRAAEPKLLTIRLNRPEHRLFGIEIQVLGFVAYVPLPG